MANDIIQIKRTTNLSSSTTLKFGELTIKSSGGSMILLVGNETETPIEIGGTNFAKLNSSQLEQNIKNVFLKYININ